MTDGVGWGEKRLPYMSLAREAACLAENPQAFSLDLHGSPKRHFHTAPEAAPSLLDLRWVSIKDHSIFTVQGSG